MALAVRGGGSIRISAEQEGVIRSTAVSVGFLEAAAVRFRRLALRERESPAGHEVARQGTFLLVLANRCTGPILQVPLAANPAAPQVAPAAMRRVALAAALLFAVIPRDEAFILPTGQFQLASAWRRISSSSCHPGARVRTAPRTLRMSPRLSAAPTDWSVARA